MADHRQRIMKQLTKLGFSWYGLSKLETKYLPSIIKSDEKIGGAVYGAIGSGGSGMLVATDRRIIFVDRKPFFTNMDELSYDTVLGLKSGKSALANELTLYTKLGDYTLRYVNEACRLNFINFLESKRIGVESDSKGNPLKKTSDGVPPLSSSATKEAQEFLRTNNLAVLSTVDKSGNADGAVVFYMVDDQDFIYVLTKSETHKAKNIHSNRQVALTIHQPGTLKTLQVQAIAEIETNQTKKDIVVKTISGLRKKDDPKTTPPVTKIPFGSFVVIRMMPQNMKYSDYANESYKN